MVNDTCGHSAGDELLRQLTAHISTRCAIPTPSRASAATSSASCWKTVRWIRRCAWQTLLLDEVRAFRFIWLDKTFTIGVSIGLVAITETSGNSATVLSAADTACYAAKDNGRNRVQVYSPDDKEMAERHGEMHWVARITKAFEEERFLLYYQPIVPGQGVANREQHFEILPRMLDEDDNLVPPGVFIPAAERYNMMDEIERWVVHNALNWLIANAERPVICAINLSGQSVTMTASSLPCSPDQAPGVPPHKIFFEIITASMTRS